MAGHIFTRIELDTIFKKVVNKTLGQVDVNNVFAEPSHIRKLRELPEM